MSVGANEGNRTLVSALARPHNNLYTTSAWYLRRQSGSSALQCDHAGEWSRQQESNLQPTDYKSVALPIAPRRHMECVTGFEPVPSAWKAEMLAAGHHTHI